MLQHLAGFNWEEVGAHRGAERFTAELGAMIKARQLLDETSTVTEGRELLAALAERGEYVHVSAALSLARIAESSDERAVALEVLTGLLNRTPEQTELLTPEIERLEKS